MERMTQAFLDRVDRDIKATADTDGFGQVDLWKVFQYLSIDIIGDIAFGKTFNMLENSDHAVPRVIANNMRLSCYVSIRRFSGGTTKSTSHYTPCIACEPTYCGYAPDHVFVLANYFRQSVLAPGKVVNLYLYCEAAHE